MNKETDMALNTGNYPAQAEAAREIATPQQVDSAEVIAAFAEAAERVESINAALREVADRMWGPVPEPTSDPEGGRAEETCARARIQSQGERLGRALEMLERTQARFHRLA